MKINVYIVTYKKNEMLNKNLASLNIQIFTGDKNESF